MEASNKGFCLSLPEIAKKKCQGLKLHGRTGILAHHAANRTTLPLWKTNPFPLVQHAEPTVNGPFAFHFREFWRELLRRYGHCEYVGFASWRVFFLFRFCGHFTDFPDERSVNNSRKIKKHHEVKPRYSPCPQLLKISGQNSQNWSDEGPLNCT